MPFYDIPAKLAEHILSSKEATFDPILFARQTGCAERTSSISIMWLLSTSIASSSSSSIKRYEF